MWTTSREPLVSWAGIHEKNKLLGCPECQYHSHDGEAICPWVTIGTVHGGLLVRWRPGHGLPRQNEEGDVMHGSLQLHLNDVRDLSQH
jgi:hypothetical protein